MVTDVPICEHCGRVIMRSDVVRAVYSSPMKHPALGLHAEPVGEPKYVHRDCFDDLAGLSYTYDPSEDKLVVHDPQIEMGRRRSPSVRACCASPIGRVVWSLTYGDLSVSPRRGVVFREQAEMDNMLFPDTYICPTCGDMYVQGEA